PPPPDDDPHGPGPGRLDPLPGHCSACTTPALGHRACGTPPAVPARRRDRLRPWFAPWPAAPAPAAAPFPPPGSSPYATDPLADGPPSDRHTRTGADGA